ncbi:phage protein [Streptococcus pyogenes]|nr:oxidoreductase [Streptococcus pyogenes]VHF74617.1 phage protein [Streptococcus pyogenes]
MLTYDEFKQAVDDGYGAMLSIESWNYPFDGIDKCKNPTFKISQH